ncbi:hypothetical protein L1049_027787 [Liquidambar formosana]|uniref:U3 small nucleolar ribonucleoprotein protein MPP10 n=1 Tax=Liquidambar formosana TaxID=63359 RepID=A0AAP0RJR8_LIQFO
MADPNGGGGGGGVEALHRLKSIDPPLWLSPSPELSQTARLASQHLFSSLLPFTPKSPFDRLLIDGFDAEQIWQQIDLQSQPLISSLRRELKRFEKNPQEISKLFGENKVLDEKRVGLEEESQGFDEVDEYEDMEAFDEDDEEGEEGEDGEEEDEEKDQEEEEEDEGGGGDGGIEDRFLKIKDLEEYLEEDEAREYGLKKTKKKSNGVKVSSDTEEDDDKEEDDEDGDEEDEEEDDELGEFGLGGDENEGMDELATARYQDFFGAKKQKVSKKKSKLIDGSEDSGTGDEEEDAKLIDGSEDSGMGDEEEDAEGFGSQKKRILSTHEQELERLRSNIEEMERANLEPRTWTMQGEVTAAKRPKNSALEVDLDFEHNVRPAPVITEDVTASIEDLIRKRILESRFDDVQKAPSLPSKAPREYKELDENKSKKGLAEIYEEEYAQKTSLINAPLSFSDEQKKEASMLFKKLCLKLDALSHFHFTPKPVIDDMSIQANVPALAMEEIAPMAVSDAAMLAPEEVFSGKGDIKEDAEITQAERKRRRANKKRKFKAEAAKRTGKKARDSTLPSGKEA